MQLYYLYSLLEDIAMLKLISLVPGYVKSVTKWVKPSMTKKLFFLFISFIKFELLIFL